MHCYCYLLSSFSCGFRRLLSPADATLRVLTKQVTFFTQVICFRVQDALIDRLRYFVDFEVLLASGYRYETQQTHHRSFPIVEDQPRIVSEGSLTLGQTSALRFCVPPAVNAFVWPLASNRRFRLSKTSQRLSILLLLPMVEPPVVQLEATGRP